MLITPNPVTAILILSMVTMAVFIVMHCVFWLGRYILACIRYGVDNVYVYRCDHCNKQLTPLGVHVVPNANLCAECYTAHLEDSHLLSLSRNLEDKTK